MKYLYFKEQAWKIGCLWEEKRNVTANLIRDKNKLQSS